MIHSYRDNHALGDVEQDVGGVKPAAHSRFKDGSVDSCLGGNHDGRRRHQFKVGRSVAVEAAVVFYYGFQPLCAVQPYLKWNGLAVDGQPL